MIPYMTFAGKNLLTELNTVVDLSKSFGNPDRSYEYVEILGKDGSLVIDNERYNDLEIDLPAFILKDFIPNYRNLMAFLNSQKGYQRLETSHEPDYFRKALFLGTVQPEPTQFLKKGSFTLPFRVHPQRFLKSGEIPVSASSQSVSYTGNPVEIDNPSGISAVNSLAVALEPIQTGTGEPSPTNIRPITGHTSASVTRTGKNALHNVATSRTADGITWTVGTDGTVTANGTATKATEFPLTGSLNSADFAGMILNGAPSSNDQYIIIEQVYGSPWSRLAADTGNGVTLPSTTYPNVRFNITVNSGATLNNVVFEPMVRPAGTSADFEPYTGNTYTINLNGTRYGGTVDLATGVLTVDRVCKTLTTARNLSGTYQGSIIYNRNSSETSDADFAKPIICNRLKYVGTLITDFTFGTVINFGDTSFNLWLKDGAFSSLSEATAWLNENETQICYYLATPQTVQLTPQQISLLTGINYISSSDEVTVTVSEPSLLENPTLFESKPLIRVYGHGTLTVNNQYITIAENPYEYIDIDCDIMDAFYGANNANQYVTLPNDYITLKSGNNYVAYDGTVQITPRWYEV